MATFYSSSLVFLFLVVPILTTKIENFDAKADIGLFGEHSTIYSNFIELWAKVTGCPEDKCSCEVTLEKRPGTVYRVEFLKEKPQIGRTTITELEPFTTYKFTLTCQGEKETDKISSTKEFRMDKGRPSAPENFAAKIETNSVKLTWAPPKQLAGPVDFYRLWINNVITPENITADKNSYEIMGSGQTTLSLTACVVNLNNDIVCSSPDNAKLQVTFPTTTTTTTVDPGTGSTSSSTAAESSTTPKSFAVSSSSISTFTMIVALCFALNRFER